MAVNNANNVNNNQRQGRHPETPEEMENFKVRMFTNIPSNYVLVGENIFTKNRKVYQKAMFHMPWFRSRYIKMENQNMDLAKREFETSSGGLSVVVDAAVTWRVKPIESNYKMTVKTRWQSVLDNLRSGKISTILKTGAVALGTIAAGVFLGPIPLVAIPAISAGYVSFFHQDQEWVNRQGAIQRAYNTSAAMAELEQIIYGELNSFYATHTYEQVKGMRVDLSDPAFSTLNNSLREYSEQYGIEITKINLKSVDLTQSSNDVLRRRQEADVQAYTARKTAEGKQYDYDRITAFMDDLAAKGYTREQIIELIKLDQATRNGAAVVVGGGATPIIPMPQPGTLQNNNQNPQNTGGRTR